MLRRGIEGIKIFGFEVGDGFLGLDKPLFFREYSRQRKVGYLRLLRINLTKDSKFINWLHSYIRKSIKNIIYDQITVKNTLKYQEKYS